MSEELRTTVRGLVRRHRVEVYVLNEDKQILASYYEGRSPSMPGGGIDLGESPTQAAARELMEEAGWIADNYRVALFNFDNVFKSTGCQWLMQDGVDEEVQHVVLCNGIKYQPDTRFGSEGDSSSFAYMSIDNLAFSTKRFIDNNVQLGIHYDRANYRLKVIQSLFGIDKFKPAYENW